MQFCNTGREASLVLRCRLQLGLASQLTQLIYKNNGRIVYHEQNVDDNTRYYYTCLKWDRATMIISDEEMESQIAHVLIDMDECEWRVHYSEHPYRMAIFVSHEPWCLYDILARSQSGEWNIEIPLIISNHPELEPIARKFGIEFHHFTVNKINKEKVERLQLAMLQKLRIDFIVLARYMQILSKGFVQAFPSRIINIHHAFLPSFPGARPYHSARDRGVKMIGATSHYATETLDAGPIIEQDVVRVNHRHSVEDLVRLGRDLEKIVLSRAIWSHIHDKVIVHDGRTVVFD